MLVTGIGSKKNMLQLEDVTGKSWYKIDESNEEHQNIVNELSVGDNVLVEYSTINGVKNINSLNVNTAVVEEKTVEKAEPVTNTLKVGGANNFPASVVPKFACKTCGKSMINGTYENCYDCNMKTKATKTPAVQTHIARQSIGHMTSVTVGAMLNSKQYPKPVNTKDVLELIETIYDKYKTKVLGE